MSKQHANSAALGLDMEQSLSQLKKGKLTYALNAMIEGYDGKRVNYQNEPGNIPCVTFPEGYVVLRAYPIYEMDWIIYWLLNPDTGDSEIGRSSTKECDYTTVINSKCLNFDIEHPILSVVHRVDNCSVQVFWVDGHNRDRFLDFDNLPWKEIDSEVGCENIITNEVDCNKLSINPFFSIPQLEVQSVEGDGTIQAGTVQFGIQYANASGEAYTSVYSITNPVPIFDPNNVSLNFDTTVNRSVNLYISDLDDTGYFDYYNVVVIHTVNNIPTAKLVGTYLIRDEVDELIYVGQSIKDMSMPEIFLKYPIYEISNDITSANDVLIRSQLSTEERLSYQQIASQIEVQWQAWKLTKDFTYKVEEVATNLKSYMRDEVYALDLVPLLRSGKQTDRFHIPGRKAYPSDMEFIYNDDVVDTSKDACDENTPLPRWRVYNTARKIGFEQEYLDASQKEVCYKGPYEYGDMAYWESAEEYPCDREMWGDLAGQKIRHHKMPDCLVTHIHDDSNNIFPLGLKISLFQIRALIEQSSLTREQKDDIIGFKIVRGNRANNKSIVAKGLIHNVGSYTKDEATYFFPNYPYNDVGEDEFISGQSTAVNVSDLPDNPDSSLGCYTYQVTNGLSATIIEYQDCDGNTVTRNVEEGEIITVCSPIRPYSLVKEANIKISQLGSCDNEEEEEDEDEVVVGDNLQGFIDPASKRRFVFHSPDTHFYQPFLGTILKLETAEYGQSKGHFVQTKDHAKYKLFTEKLYLTATTVMLIIAGVSRVVGVSSTIMDGTAMFTAYRTVVEILERASPRINYAYHYSSYGEYYNYVNVPNEGNKQRLLDISTYLNPGMASVGDTQPINNFHRESSVYLRATKGLPFTHEAGAPEDVSRWLPQCDKPNAMEFKDISSYYAAIKKGAISQYGQLHTYESVDTGYQFKLKDKRDYVTVFGGDIFINKFGYKSKLPYFIDNRVKVQDDSDVFYNEIGNVGNPNYWFSLDSTRGGTQFSLFSIPIANLHCLVEKWTYKRGRMYLFSYGIPYFFCESEVNVDYRQAFNNKEGEFFPHVSSDIPDEWLQESFVSIANDNTYYYNKTYSKQNKENYFSTLPADYSNEECRRIFPYRTVFSESRGNNPQSTQRNNWLIYKPSSYYDFPQSFGKLTALNGIEHSQVLARFENRTQIYNALKTMATSEGAAYLGASMFSQTTPPIDLAVTDIGFAGSRHKFLLRTEYGAISVDDKRGHVFLINGQSIKNLTDSESGVEQFFNRNLEVRLPLYFPEVPIDNHYNGVGITGVYDARFNRLILTKLDYEPLIDGITYTNQKFYFGGKVIQLTDPLYFCNRSFTVSYDFDYGVWVSFHSYLPSYYVGMDKFFISGKGNKSWQHLLDNTYNHFFGEVHPYTIELPYTYAQRDEILQSVSDYCQTFQYVNGEEVQVDDVWYNKVILYNNQQSSGLLEPIAKPKRNMAAYMRYPQYNTSSKTILFTKSDNYYNINQFWSLLKDNRAPIFTKSCRSLSFDKELNQDNMNYSKLSFNKAPLRSKDLKCRFTLDNRSDTRIVSQITITESQESFK